MKRVLFITLLVFSVLAVFSQEKEKKSIGAVRIQESIKIDAVLDEPVWQRSETATDFIQSYQDPGKPSNQKTEVRILYDDKAIYVSGVMYEVSKDSILRELSKRDEYGNTDYFAVFFDTYNSGINAFGFYVSSAGVQGDALLSSNGTDSDWDAVWESAVQILDDRWQIEFKIPYSALRFSEADIQIWGINFFRSIRRLREESNWNFINPEESGSVSQYGTLTGISNIKAPLRLSITPFVSAYAVHFPYNQDGIDNLNHTYNGGLDLKYGISESFTLDMVLIPDFGQVQSDNEILNLSPFETRFSENRPFFTEGTDIFSKGNIFYSRRVGGRPIGFDEVEDQLNNNEEITRNPQEAELINATKISGRTKTGLGIGFFNAVGKRIYATVRDTLTGESREVLTSPLANYNVLVLDQNLKNNSSVSLINTNLTRESFFYDANVTAVAWSLKDKKQKYRFSGGGALSQILNTNDTDLGYQAYWSFNKISGNWQFYSGHTIESDTYDPNDLGFLNRNNENSFYVGGQFIKFKPFWKLNRLSTNLNIWYNRLYKPNEFTDFGIHFDGFMIITKSFIGTGFWVEGSPVETFDYFEPRVEGRYFTRPKNIAAGGWFSTDYRNKFALDVNISYRDYDDLDRYNFNWFIEPRFRFNDKFKMVYEFERDIRFSQVGYVTDFSNDSIIFGRRDLVTHINSLEAEYIFNNKMALEFSLRHYWSKAEYKAYNLLTEDGYLEAAAYNENNDINFNAFTIDMAYTWRFAPGSDVIIVWKNSIFTDASEVEKSFSENLKNTIESPQTNSFSIKLLYYIDYLSLFGKTG